ncbi:MAG: di-heme oxidoredictase family protein [Acidimicrobiia bacterium]
MIIAGCSSTSSHLLAEDPGGDTTTPLNNRNAFGSPAPNLTDEQRQVFEIGDSFFTQPWVVAPASTDARDGLGPLFNATSCSACHVLEGRGSPPMDGDEPERGLLFRIGVDRDGIVSPHEAYGNQLQDRSIQGVPVEGAMSVVYEQVLGSYGDGSSYTLRHPAYSVSDPSYGPVGDHLISPRVAPAVFGMGLIEAIPGETILANADPHDENGDGISGRANHLYSKALGMDVLGRLGWKANVATVEDQVAAAFLDDIGITSPFHPAENCTTVQVECQAAVNGGSPEVTAERLAQIVFYNSTLAVPQRRNLDEPEVQAGAELFAEMQCTACHVPIFDTGDHRIDAVSNQRITPFSDFLLHDMGAGLADGMPDGLASGTEWRTPPLWGIGLIEEVNGHSFLLHDGRARSIEEAILWHGGEAAASQNAFTALTADERAEVIAFLESL